MAIGTERQMTGRWARLHHAIAAAELDAVALVAPANVAYASGFLATPHERLIMLIVPAEGPGRLVLPALEEQAARTAVTSDLRLFVWSDDRGPAEQLAEAIDGLPSGPRIGIEKRSLTVGRCELLTSVANGPSFVDCDPLIERARMIKDEQELAALRRAAAIVDRAVVRLASEELIPGRTEAEVAAACGRIMREEGSQRDAFDPAVLAGPRSALPHGVPGQARLAEGQLVIVDIGSVCDGYCADITRTFVLGRAGARERELFELVDRARAAAVQAIAPGVTGAEADRAARSVIEQAGYGDRFIHRTGHGLGLEVHEAPDLAASNPQPLEPGMVVTVEPGVYLGDLGGVRIEDDVAVTADGCHLLTHAPIELEI